MISSLGRAIGAATQDGLRFLVAGQGRDGFWRDYELQPGPSDVWVTAWVGWCVAQCRAADPAVRHAQVIAARAVCAAVGPGGWGYSRSTGPDADSTAWACRFLAMKGAHFRGGARLALLPFLDADGAAHTFREPGVGRWGEAHPEVTPMVGLALTEAAGPSPSPVPLIRDRVIRDQAADGSWAGFWWESHIYATAWSLVFLAATSGIPAATAQRGRRALRAVRETADGSAFELALLLLAWASMEPLASDTLDVVDCLLTAQQQGGGWTPSALLLVPDRYPVAEGPSPQANADGCGLLTTSLACAALAAAVAALAKAPR